MVCSMKTNFALVNTLKVGNVVNLFDMSHRILRIRLDSNISAVLHKPTAELLLIDSNGSTSYHFYFLTDSLPVVSLK